MNGKVPEVQILKIHTNQRRIITITTRVIKGHTIGIDFDHVRSFDTKLAPQISRQPFDLYTKLYGDIHTDIVLSHTGYDVIIYFWLEVIAKKNC